jgi:hypothetical protein
MLISGFRPRWFREVVVVETPFLCGNPMDAVGTAWEADGGR